MKKEDNGNVGHFMNNEEKKKRWLMYLGKEIQIH